MKKIILILLILTIYVVPAQDKWRLYTEEDIPIELEDGYNTYILKSFNDTLFINISGHYYKKYKDEWTYITKTIRSSPTTIFNIDSSGVIFERTNLNRFDYYKDENWSQHFIVTYNWFELSTEYLFITMDGVGAFGYIDLDTVYTTEDSFPELIAVGSNPWISSTFSVMNDNIYVAFKTPSEAHDSLFVTQGNENETENIFITTIEKSLTNNRINSLTAKDSILYILDRLDTKDSLFFEYIVYDLESKEVSINRYSESKENLRFISPSVIDNNGKSWFPNNGPSSKEDIPSPGLICFDGTEWIVYDSLNVGLPTHKIYSIAVDSDNTKWITTDKGLIEFNENGLSSVEQTLPEETINLFPNPTKDLLNLTVNGDYHFSTYSISDINGRGIAKNITLNSNQINIQNLSKGVYFIEFTTIDGRKTSKKFVKE